MPLVWLAFLMVLVETGVTQRHFHFSQTGQPPARASHFRSWSFSHSLGWSFLWASYGSGLVWRFGWFGSS